MKKSVLFLMSAALLFGSNVMADDQPQVPNGDFESWTFDGENLPDNWNSFQTATGTWAGMGYSSSNRQVKRSTDVRPGSNGQYSCSIWARSVFGVVAQGNLTSGRVHAGSTSAANKANYNYTDREGAASANGKAGVPCAMEFTGKPSAVKVWVKYVQGGTGYGEYNKAKFSAIIHSDADYISYGLPENDTPENKSLVVASAVKEIEYNDGEWVELTIPFEYTNNDVEPAYIQINASTNAYPGKGKANDYLYIDDIEMVYESAGNVKVFEKDPLYVTVSGAKTGPYDATVYVTENDDNTINFQLKNFMLDQDGDLMPVGNINVNNIPVTKADGLTNFADEQTIQIEEGDDPTAPYWAGPMLGDIPLKLSGCYSDEHLYVTIDIPLSDELQVYVELGTNPNVKVFDQDPLYVTVNEEKTGPYPATVYVTDNGDQTINFQLKNFMLDQGGDLMPVGNINVNNIPVTKADGLTNFADEQTIQIEEGDDPTAPYWAGPMLGDIPLKLSGCYSDEHLYVTIDIPLSDEMQVYVELGNQGDVTGIFTVKTAAPKAKAAQNVIYDLNGRKVSEMQRGRFYIVDGKIVMN